VPEEHLQKIPKNRVLKLRFGPSYWEEKKLLPQQFPLKGYLLSYSPATATAYLSPPAVASLMICKMSSYY
jgi:hypothetical protein